MQIETHDRLGAPARKPATRLVVYDDFRNPVAVFIQVDRHNIFFRHKGMPDFEAALRNLGVADTAVVTVVDAKALPELRVE